MMMGPVRVARRFETQRRFHIDLSPPAVLLVSSHQSRSATRMTNFAWIEPIHCPPINQSARLAAGRCSCYVRSVGCKEHDMRLMMQGLTDAAFEQRFGAEDACLAALAAARQAAGMACPRCGNPKSYVYGRRVGCTRCNQRWSVTSGTVMADTKLPLTHWFRAMHLMTSTRESR